MRITSISFLVQRYIKHAKLLPKDLPATDENNSKVIEKLLGKPGKTLSGKILLEKKSVQLARLENETPKQTLKRLFAVMEEKELNRTETLPGQYPVS